MMMHQLQVPSKAHATISSHINIESRKRSWRSRNNFFCLLVQHQRFVLLLLVLSSMQHTNGLVQPRTRPFALVTGGTGRTGQKVAGLLLEQG